MQMRPNAGRNRDTGPSIDCMQQGQTAVEAAAPAVVGAFAIPLRLPFRDTPVRTGLLVRGPAGWGEWSPFAGYGPRLTARWWHAAVEAATAGWPPARRTEVPVNAIIPAVGPERAHRCTCRGSPPRTS